MESVTGSLREKIVFHSKVVDVRERKIDRYISGIGDEAIFTEIGRGWFVLLDGSHEALHVGMEKPELVKGDRVKITLEKVNG